MSAMCEMREKNGGIPNKEKLGFWSMKGIIGIVGIISVLIGLIIYGIFHWIL